MRISGKGLEGEAAGGTGGLKERVPEASRRKAPRRGGAGHPFILSRAVGAPVENARPKRRRRGILEALRRIDGGIPPDIRSTAPAPSAQDDGRRTGYRGTTRGAKSGFPRPPSLSAGLSSRQVVVPVTNRCTFVERPKSAFPAYFPQEKQGT
ncbi:hypothetical protein HMPREF9440_00290 [Sutterella parvirubra YIT 11816]|uniref:Uncharacterized protein n=1 Tax=Sutterella parvirubra YIT 11816 TaxID=762967 RepID=H3KC41_9BURK|nr:hypothetical protein HMPREF9440_00290 [Sutterella parvirubra YIT 11816]